MALLFCLLVHQVPTAAQYGAFKMTKVALVFKKCVDFCVHGVHSFLLDSSPFLKAVLKDSLGIFAKNVPLSYIDWKFLM